LFLFFCKVRIVAATIAFVKRDGYFGINKSPLNEKNHLDKEGGYYLPSAPAGTSFEEMEKLTQNQIGKPWASIQYHASLEYNMGLNMLRGLTANIFIVWLLCWILGKISSNNFSTTLLRHSS